MDFEVSNQGDGYVLGAAVLLYHQKTHYQNGNSPEAFATVHTVREDGGRPVLNSGRPMTEQDYGAMVNVLTPSERPQMVWQDHSILARGLGRIIWWTPAMNRPMFFKESGLMKGTFTGQAVCPVPAMVWHATPRGLYVYAIKGNGMPERDTPLCQAPLFNIWSRGLVCAGNASLPDADRRGDPKEWEKFLFCSHFTHPNFTEKNRLVKGVDPMKFWRDMTKSPAATFPEDRLVNVPLTINDLVANDFEEKLANMKAKGEF